MVQPVLGAKLPEHRYNFGGNLDNSNLGAFLVENFRIATGKIEIQELYIRWLMERGLFNIAIFNGIRENYGIPDSSIEYSDGLVKPEILGDLDRHKQLMDNGLISEEQLDYLFESFSSVRGSVTHSELKRESDQDQVKYQVFLYALNDIFRIISWITVPGSEKSPGYRLRMEEVYNQMNTADSTEYIHRLKEAGKTLEF